MDGEWKSGDRLYDNELADQLGTSRNSVREALSNLVENRLVEKEHWKGYKVRTPEWEEIAEAIDLRECLEFFAFQKIEQLPKDKFNKALTMIENQLKESKASLELDFCEFHKIDMIFHEIIYRMISPYWLENIMRNLKAITDLQMNAHFKLYPEVARLSYEQHYGIFQKLKQRDFEGIKPLLMEHLESYKERSREAYQNSIQNQNTEL